MSEDMGCCEGREKPIETIDTRPEITFSQDTDENEEAKGG